MSWRTLKLGEFLTQKKRQIAIDPDTEYSLVTITNKGQIKLREKKIGATINAQKGYITKTGDFIYSRLSVHTGAFGLVPDELDGALITNEMPCFEIDETKILPVILTKILGLPSIIWQLKQLTQGMGRVRIKEKAILSLSLPLPDINEQEKILSRFLRIEDEDKELKNELTHQLALLKKLRQQILQEAIEGKLTADWRTANPNTEPASELLKRIATEKATQLKTRKTKKQKPLPPITDKEKPFTLPNGWEWLRIREFATQSVDCPHDTPKYQDVGYYCLRAPDVTESGLLVEKIRRVSQEEYEKRIRRLTPQKNDLVYIREGGRLGIAGLIDIDDPVCLGQRVMLLRFLNQELSEYTACFLNAPNTFQDITEKTFGSASPHVNVRDILAHVIPVPPQEEQKAIINKVEKLLTLCDQLETRITQNQTHADALMQAVLNEAFTKTPKKN